MQLTVALLKKISPVAKNTSNMQSVVDAVNQYGAKFGLDQPHRLAHFIAQLAHESGDFRYDEEIASGAAYEGRKDLGNTQRGDGKKFKGHGPEQVTGRANTTEYRDWVWKNINPDAPDFVKDPKKINTDPYEGLSAIWYWDKKKLNRLADANDIEMITERVNGGLNGFEDRKAKYDRAALAFLGESLAGQPKQYIKAFQMKEGLEHVDGISGPRTRAAMHHRLVMLTEKRERAGTVQAAPVVAKEAVPVKIASLEGNTAYSAETVTTVGTVGATVVGALNGLDWKVAISVVGVVALLGGFLIYRRWTAKAQQTAQVEAINAKSLL